MGAVAQTQLVLSSYALVETTVHNSSLGDIFTNISQIIWQILADIHLHLFGVAAAALGKVYSIGTSSSGSGREQCVHTVLIAAAAAAVNWNSLRSPRATAHY